MRVLLGWAWTYLIVAELIGVSSGITYFINQQAKYRNYESVFASIILIGLIGLVTDLVLASLGRQLFPWLRTARAGWFSHAGRHALRGAAPRRPRDAAPASADVARREVIARAHDAATRCPSYLEQAPEVRGALRASSSSAR